MGLRCASMSGLRGSGCRRPARNLRTRPKVGPRTSFDAGKTPGCGPTHVLSRDSLVTRFCGGGSWKAAWACPLPRSATSTPGRRRRSRPSGHETAPDTDSRIFPIRRWGDGLKWRQTPRWRMGWDSNPRGGFPPGGFQDRCLKPLGHPSAPSFYRRPERARQRRPRLSRNAAPWPGGRWEGRGSARAPPRGWADPPPRARWHRRPGGRGRGGSSRC